MVIITERQIDIYFHIACGKPWTMSASSIYNDLSAPNPSTVPTPLCPHPEDTSGSPCQACGTKEPAGSSDLDALFYIVVVLAFYAFAMVVLMVKYIRRENREAALSYMYHEYIERETFSRPSRHNRSYYKVLPFRQVIRQPQFYETSI